LPWQVQTAEHNEDKHGHAGQFGPPGTSTIK
jgi:hypothetical protein